MSQPRDQFEAVGLSSARLKRMAISSLPTSGDGPAELARVDVFTEDGRDPGLGA